LATAQVEFISNATSTPLPGTGHNYLGMFNETVNPSNGSVSLRIGAPTPPGRRMKLPFSISYDSGGLYYGNAQGLRGGGGGYMSIGAWSYSIPMMSYSGSKTETGCPYHSTFIFYDPLGIRHPLQAYAYPSQVSPPCSGTPHMPFARSNSAGSIQIVVSVKFRPSVQCVNSRR